MGIYIKGMDMPTYEQGDLVLRVRCDGRVDKDYSGNTVATAVPVPPHGRLIDAVSKSFQTPHRNPTNDYMKGWNACLRSVQQQPTIIPAEEGEA